MELEKRLKGERTTEPSEGRQHEIFSMIDIIENQWPRSLYPCVYEALLFIQHAQATSVACHRKSVPFDVDVLGFSFRKGGSSVLAHGFLVAPEKMTVIFHFFLIITCKPKGEVWLYGAGIALQLLDDLEDLESDLAHGQMTLFSSCASCGFQVDSLVVKLFAFFDWMCDNIDDFSPSCPQKLRDVLRFGLCSLTALAAGRAKRFISNALFKRVDQFNALPFTQLVKVVQGVGKRKKEFFQNLDSLLSDQRFLPFFDKPLKEVINV